MTKHGERSTSTKEGTGKIRVNNQLIDTIEPKMVRMRLREPVLLAGTVADKIIWTGLGCTLIRRKIFEELEKPWFRTDMEAVAVHEGSSSSGYRLHLRPRTLPALVGYGGQDLYFCAKAVISGFTIGEVIGVLAEHLTQEERNGSEKAECSNRPEELIPKSASA